MTPLRIFRQLLLMACVVALLLGTFYIAVEADKSAHQAASATSK